MTTYPIAYYKDSDNFCNSKFKIDFLFIEKQTPSFGEGVGYIFLLLVLLKKSWGEVM